MKKILFSFLIASQIISSAFATINSHEKIVLDEAALSIKQYAAAYEKTLPQLNKENYKEVCREMLSANTKALTSRLNQSDKDVRSLELKGQAGERVSNIVMKTAAVAVDAQLALAKACSDNSLAEDQNIILKYYRSVKNAKTDLTVSLVKLK